MRSSFSKSGNIIIDGIAGANNYNYASLDETHLVSNTTDSKSAVYWVRGNNKSYLMGFYQRDELVFQVAFPCTRNEKAKGLNKLQEIANALNIKNPVWQTQEPQVLTVNSNPVSFWKDPYEKLYMRLGIMPALQVKLKNTLFEDLDFRENSVFSGTYRVDTTKENEDYTLDIAQEKTTLSALEWQENAEYIAINGAVDKVSIIVQLPRAKVLQLKSIKPILRIICFLRLYTHFRQKIRQTLLP